MVSDWRQRMYGRLAMLRSAGLARLCALTLFLLIGSTARAELTAIRAGHVVDPKTATVLSNQIILIENGKIREIGPSVTIPPEATLVDLSKRTVLPGLIDAHTHLLAAIDPKWDLGDTWIMTLQRRPGYRAILGARHAREVLEAGFTTVRDVGNSGEYLDTDLEKAIRFGVVPGPTVIPAGRIIAPFGGQFWDKPADPKLLNNPEYYFADSRDEMRKAVRENIYWGAKVIKIVVDGQRYQYTADDIRFIVEEAARAGTRVAAHVQTQRGARAAIEARVASIEHAWELTDEDLLLARKNSVTLVSTDFTVSQLLANGFDRERATSIHAKRVERLRRAYTSGVTIAFGTDIMNAQSTPTRGVQALEYIDSFVEAGIPAPDILRAMTSNAARLLDMENVTGSLQAGMAADLVAVSGNPLQDINALKAVSFVMRSGRIYRDDGR